MKITKNHFKSLVTECLNEAIQAETTTIASHDLEAIEQYVQTLEELVTTRTLEDWQKSKITLAKAYLESVVCSLNTSPEEQTADVSAEQPDEETPREPVGGAIEIPSSTQDGDETDDLHEANCVCAKCNGIKEAKKKVKNWIQKAVDKKRKGACTSTTKKACTPARKMLIKKFKKGV